MTQFIHVAALRLCQSIPFGNPSNLPGGCFFGPCSCPRSSCCRPSLLLYSSCFFFLLSISSGDISPLQCWLSASSKSSRFFSLGFHIALASIGVLGSFDFFPICGFLSGLCSGTHLVFGVVLSSLERTDGGCSVYL